MATGGAGTGPLNVPCAADDGAASAISAPHAPSAADVPSEPPTGPPAVPTAVGGAGTASAEPLHVPATAAAAAGAGQTGTSAPAAATGLNVPIAAPVVLNVPVTVDQAPISAAVVEWVVRARIADRLAAMRANVGGIATLAEELGRAHVSLMDMTPDQSAARLAKLREGELVPNQLPAETRYASLHKPLQAARGLMRAECTSDMDAPVPDPSELASGPTLTAAEVSVLLRLSVDDVLAGFQAVTDGLAGARSAQAAVSAVYATIGIGPDSSSRRLQQVALLGDEASPLPLRCELDYAIHMAPVAALRKLIVLTLPPATPTPATSGSAAAASDVRTTERFAEFVAEERKRAAAATRVGELAALHTMVQRVASLPVTDEPVVRCGKDAEAVGVFVRLVILGDFATGKSCLWWRMTQSKWVRSRSGSAGADFVLVDIGSTRVYCWLRDTPSYNRGGGFSGAVRVLDGSILVYDPTNPDTLVGVRRWMAFLEEHAKPLPPCILAASCCDSIKSGLRWLHGAVLVLRRPC